MAGPAPDVGEGVSGGRSFAHLVRWSAGQNHEQQVQTERQEREPRRFRLSASLKRVGSDDASEAVEDELSQAGPAHRRGDCRDRTI